MKKILYVFIILSIIMCNGCEIQNTFYNEKNKLGKPCVINGKKWHELPKYPKEVMPDKQPLEPLPDKIR